MSDINSYNSSPRYNNMNTFAGLPIITDKLVDIGIIGIPFDSGTTFRPGARFGPNAIRQSSHMLMGYNPIQRVYPFRDQIVADLENIACTPFNNKLAVKQITEGMLERLLQIRNVPIIIGGDHTISYPVLKAIDTHYQINGEIALLHFDSHMDTHDQYFDQPITHGTPFRRAVEDGHINPHRSLHVGVHGSINDEHEIDQDRTLGFKTITTSDIYEKGVSQIVKTIKKRIGNMPCYISIDVDVVDPSGAPGTGTPESGGLTQFQIISIIQQLRGLDIIGGDVVEVSPPYDVSNITSQLAATLVYELISLATP